MVDEDRGGVKCVPIDSNLDELDSIRIGTHFKLSRPDILKWKGIDHLKDQEKEVLVSNMILLDASGMKQELMKRIMGMKQGLTMRIMTNSFVGITQKEYNWFIKKKEGDGGSLLGFIKRC